MKNTEQSAPPERLHEESFVVAIGASAGGLDALERLFDSLPADSGSAFIVIQHLSPAHKSMMANLLARHTRMPVVMVEQDLHRQLMELQLVEQVVVAVVPSSTTVELALAELAVLAVDQQEELHHQQIH